MWIKLPLKQTVSWQFGEMHLRGWISEIYTPPEKCSSPRLKATSYCLFGVEMAWPLVFLAFEMWIEKTIDATQTAPTCISEAKQLQEVRYLCFSILGLSSKNSRAELRASPGTRRNTHCWKPPHSFTYLSFKELPSLWLINIHSCFTITQIMQQNGEKERNPKDVPDRPGDR